MIRIKSLRQLKRESRQGEEFFIHLKFNLRSTKWIEWDAQNRVFNVINFIDGSEQTLTEKQLMDQKWSNIGHAISCGWLYKDC
jgi:hypothetical protein